MSENELKELKAERDDLAWLVTHYETVYDPGAVTKEDKKRGDRIFKNACAISPPATDVKEMRDMDSEIADYTRNGPGNCIDG